MQRIIYLRANNRDRLKYQDYSEVINKLLKEIRSESCWRREAIFIISNNYIQ